MDTKAYLRENIRYPKSWWLFMILWMVFGGIAWLNESDHAIFREVQSWVSFIPYQLVILITHTGVFYYIAIIILFFLWRYKPWDKKVVSILLLTTQLLPWLLLRLTKLLYNKPRPVSIYGEEDWFLSIPEVLGHTQHQWMSFPSGHTEGIAALFSFLVLMAPVKKKHYWVIFGIINILLVGLSRMYLSQHFYEDVWAGGVIGLWSGAIVYLVYERWFKPQNI